MKKLLTILLFLAFKSHAADTYYVSTTGGGSGSFASPWSLQTALDHPGAVDPGDTIYILAGTYTGTYISSLTGTLANPIIVKNIGRAILDGTLEGEAFKDVTVLRINGNYTWYWGLEITNSDPVRIIEESGSLVDLARGAGLGVFGIGVKIINFIIYDAGQGITAWVPATNSEYYGNVMFNNGWDAPDRLHGHGIYTQNDTGLKSFKDNIALNNFGYGLHAYSEGSSIKNFYWEGNVCFNDDWLMGGGTPMENLEINTNFTYKDPVNLGYTSLDNDGLIMTNNYFSGSVNMLYWHNVTATGNTIFDHRNLEEVMFIYFYDASNTPPDLSTWAFDNNTYYWVNPQDLQWIWINSAFAPGPPDGEGWWTLAQWQAAGQDINETIEYFADAGGGTMTLTGKKIFVRPNAYDANRANVVIYNWDLSSTVDVDVSSVLTAGDEYELRNVQDYFGDVITGTYSGGNLSVPMTGHTVALPFGYATAMGPNTFPEFGTFVLINTSGGGGDPPADLPGVTPVPDRGQANAVKISRNTGSGLPHVSLGTGSGGGEEFTRDNLIINEGFEGGDPWPSGVFNLGQDNLGEDHGGGTNTWARVQVNTGANEGTSVHQTEVRSGCDGCQSQGYRSEMTFDTDVAANNTEYWYGYSQKFKTPNSGGFWTGNNSGVFIQWHPTGGSGSSTVAMSNDYNENGEGFTLWTNPGGLGDVTHSESGVDIVADTWYHFVWNIFWGTAGNGYVKVWINGVLEFNVTGLDFNTEGQYMKLGMNRWSWSGPDCDASGCTTSSYPTDTWIIQYDNFRVGTSLATFNDVSPVQVLPEPRPIPVVDSLPKPTSFVGSTTGVAAGKLVLNKNIYHPVTILDTIPNRSVLAPIDRSSSFQIQGYFGGGIIWYDPRDTVLTIDTSKLRIWGTPIYLYDPTKK